MPSSRHWGSRPGGRDAADCVAEDVSGLGLRVMHGQTTIAEDFECSTMRSLSMKMLGSVEKFFYRDVAGIGLAAPVTG